MAKNTQAQDETTVSIDTQDSFGPVVSKVSDASSLIIQYGSVSGAIRALSAQGMTRGLIAKTLNKRYQHVRNVLITPIKKG